MNTLFSIDISKLFFIGIKRGFSNTVNGVTSSTIICSIIQIAIAHDLVPVLITETSKGTLLPRKYLMYVFIQIQYDKDISTYLPWLEQIPEYCKSKSPQQK